MLARFYTRANCSLCKRAYPILQRLAAEGHLTVEVIDIAADPDLTAHYGERIPLVELSNGHLLEGRISEYRLRRIIGLGQVGLGSGP